MTDTVLLRIKNDLRSSLEKVDESLRCMSSVRCCDALPEDIRSNVEETFEALDWSRDEIECILGDIEELEVPE